MSFLRPVIGTASRSSVASVGSALLSLHYQSARFNGRFIRLNSQRGSKNNPALNTWLQRAGGAEYAIALCFADRVTTSATTPQPHNVARRFPLFGLCETVRSCSSSSQGSRPDSGKNLRASLFDPSRFCGFPFGFLHPYRQETTRFGFI